jgi:hypothetical protein
MRSACRVTLYNKVIFSDELIEGDEEVRECYEEVAHHGCDAFSIQNFGIAPRSVMHDLRAYNIPQWPWQRATKFRRFTLSPFTSLAAA